MSHESNEPELNLDLHFLPEWAQKSPAVNRYSNYEGERERRSGGPRDRGFDGPPRRRDGQGGGRPAGGGGGGRPQGGRGEGGGGRGPRGQGGFDRDRKGGPRGGRFEPRQEAPLPDVKVALETGENRADSLAKQIRLTGRAYPLFEIGGLVMQKPDRYRVVFNIARTADGAVAQQLLLCALDDTLWLDEEEAMGHLLKEHLDTFYQVEKIPTDPPKGTYTFVAQCGFSGVILGPPNYHDYQVKLHKLHQERFANMAFDRFKSRVKIVKDEEVVKKWIDDQSFRTEYQALNVPEPVTLDSWEAVRTHFKETHLPNVVKPVNHHAVAGERIRELGSRELQRLAVRTVEEQRRFPLKLVNTLSQQLASRGLQFFKVNKTITHVSVARPHFLDLSVTPIAESVKKVVEFVEAHPRCTVKALVEALAPVPAAPPAPVDKEINVEAPVEEVEKKAAEKVELTPEQNQVLSDLHWLVHQGHVIEFANGELETAKKPHPKPQPKPKKVPPKPAPELKPAPEAGKAAVSQPADNADTAATPSDAAAPAQAATSGDVAPTTNTPSSEAAFSPQPPAESSGSEPEAETSAPPTPPIAPVTPAPAADASGGLPNPPDVKDEAKTDDAPEKPTSGS